MPQNDTTVNNYTAGGVSIRMQNDSPAWAASLASYLSLTPGDGPQNTPTVNLFFNETGSEKLDRLIPLPGEQDLTFEGSLLVNHPVPYRIFAKGKQRWIDYIGFGRTWIDPLNNRAQSACLKECGISSIYTNIVLAYNPLIILLSQHGYHSVHASCVQLGGKGILFTGVSGSGKSTAAYALLRRGHPILADDRVLLQNADSCRALSISDVIKLSQEAQQTFFPELDRVKPLHYVDQELYYKVTSIDHLPYLNSTQVNYLFIFERTGTKNSRLEKVNPSRVVGDLFPVTMCDFEPAALTNKFTFLMDFLENVECYRVHFGTDMEHFACLIEDLVLRKDGW